MGCGKSTVGRLLERHGFNRLDADALVHERVLTAPDVIETISQRYGPRVRAASGLIDRKALARVVFGQEGELKWLEELTHPRVFALWREYFAREPDARWIVEVPLLFEKGLENWFDFTVCVACSPPQQLARLEQRGISRVLAGQRLAKQLPLVQKIAQSDFVIWNSGSPEFLQAEVDHLAKALMSHT
jgi:dephospho-CoA kinase